MKLKKFNGFDFRRELVFFEIPFGQRGLQIAQLFREGQAAPGGVIFMPYAVRQRTQHARIISSD